MISFKSGYNSFQNEEDEEEICQESLNSHYPKLKQIGYRNQFQHLAIAIVLILIGGIAISSVIISHNSQDAESKPKVNSTESKAKSIAKCIIDWDGNCVPKSNDRNNIDYKTSANILEIMNFSIDPCDNFHQFACEGWLKKHPRPEDELWWDVDFNINKQIREIFLEMMDEPDNEDDLPIYKNTKNLYKSCMKHEDPEEIINKEDVLKVIWNVLEIHGGWPILYENGAWNPENFNWMKSVSSLMKKFTKPTMFKIMLASNDNSPFKSADTSDSDIEISVLNIQSLSLKLKTVDFIYNVTKQLLKYQNLTIDEENLIAQVLWIEELEENFNEFLDSSKFTPDLSRKYGVSSFQNRFSLEKLQNITDDLLGKNVTELFVMLFESSKIRTKSDQMFYVINIERLLNALDFLNSISKQDLALFLHFQMLKNMIIMEERSFSELIEPEEETSLTSLFGGPKRNKCKDMIGNIIPFPVLHYYLKRAFRDRQDFENTLKEVKEIFGRIKEAFKVLRFDKSQTLAEIELRKNLSATNLCFGFPDWIADRNKVEAEYFNLDLNQSTYLEQILNLNEWKWDASNQIQSVNKSQTCRLSNTNGERPYSVFEVGAFSYVETFDIYIQMGMLDKRFYGVGRNIALNYGSLAFIIGHELIHAYSRFGWQDGPAGDCLINQYNKFEMEDSEGQKVFLNGNQTLIENFADNGALPLAHFAYKLAEKERKGQNSRTGIPGLEQFSADRLFYISLAQIWCDAHTVEELKLINDWNTHSPGLYRILGTLQNNKEFSKTWNCPVGSKMNPEEKCDLYSK